MTDMPTAPAHARPARRPEGLIAAWLCMIIAGVTTVTFNCWHAFHSAMAWPVAVLVGIAPVALAMVVSHLVAVSRAGKFLKSVTFAVMLGAMALSVRATGAVVAPAFGNLWWLFGAVIDTGALVALQVLLSLKAKAAREEVQRAADEAAAADERTALRAELEAVRGKLDAAVSERETVADELAGTLGGVRAELAEAVAKTEILTRKLEAATARKRRAVTARKSGRVTARKPDPATGSATAPEEPAVTALEDEAEAPSDLDSEAKVLWYLDKGFSASKAGVAAGLTDSRGRQIARLRKPAPAGQDPQENP